MPVKECQNCGKANNVRATACTSCGNIFKKRGRPRSTSENDGFSSGGRPLGTTQQAGYGVSDGRPRGTTRETGYSVSDGRPRGTTRETGYSVSDGRPHGTTRETGSNVSPGRPCGARRSPQFDNTIQLPPDWEHSNEFVNIDNDLLDVCARRILQQRTFDKKPLGLAVCYGCGHLLWSTVDGKKKKKNYTLSRKKRFK